MSQVGYVGSNLTALVNNAQAGAYPIDRYQTVSQFSVSTNVANSCILPANVPSGLSYTVILANGAANQLNIFPPVGGQINALGANTALILLQGGSVTFISAGTNQYFTVVNQSVGSSYSVKPVITYAFNGGAGITLTAAQSGALVQIPLVAGGAGNINLPAPASGLNYTFICTGAVNNANNVTINAAAAITQGYIVDSGAVTTINNATTVQLGNATGAMTKSDQLVYNCDGTNWYFYAIVSNHTHMTTA